MINFRVKYPSYHSVNRVLVTPELAAYLLQFNTQNRKLADTTSDSYA